MRRLEWAPSALPPGPLELATILANFGYETDPEGMAQHLPRNVYPTHDSAGRYFDVNAGAVRINGEVPDQPIRVTFDWAGTGLWNPKSAEEIAMGEDTDAEPRGDMPKRSPWPKSARTT
jgi:hypothetical protein